MLIFLYPQINQNNGENLMKNILFLVTGMTPQIITETLWALACDPNNQDKWIPDEIQVCSTVDGLNQIKSRLFNDGVFQQMQQDYPQLNKIVFNENSLITIADEEQDYADIKTPHDNEVMADLLCGTIRQLSKDKNSALHVSIAGGRKTMGFYAGYALSLYGRAQDRLSHVLVEEKYEKAKNFFYPTPTAGTHFAKDKYDKVIGDSAEAQIWLADIPFVRMKQAIKDKHQLNYDNSIIEVIHKINESSNNVQLTINVHNKSIVVNNKFTISDLPAREFALLHWFADLLHYIQGLTTEFIEYYQEYRDTDELDVSVDKKFFEGAKSKLKSELCEKLGLELANNIEITQSGRGTPFYLNIDSKSISIVDKFKDSKTNSECANE